MRKSVELAETEGGGIIAGGEKCNSGMLNKKSLEKESLFVLRILEMEIVFVMRG